jgi:hypothetical protein
LYGCEKSAERQTEENKKMQTTPISGVQSTQQTQATSGEFLLELIKAAKADPNGPFGKWAASHEKELNALLSQYLSGSQGGSFAAAQLPQAYSSDQIRPEVQQNPNSFLNEPAVHSSARMAPRLTEGSDGSAQSLRESPNMIVEDPAGDGSGDDGGDLNVGSDGGDDGSDVSADGPDGSGDDTTTQGSSDDGNGGQPVQTSGGGEPSESTTSSTLNTAPEAPLQGLPDDGFTSAGEYQTLENLQADVDNAEAAALANPKDPDLAQAAQNARMRLQLEQTKASQDAAILAQHAMDALRASQLH